MSVTLRPFALCAASAIVLAVVVPAAATPPATPPPGADDVAAVLVALDQARTAHDAAALQALVKLPAKVSWRTYNAGGDCSVAKSTTLTDPAKAATALAATAPFLTALRRDKGRAVQGSTCDGDGARPFTTGDLAVAITGDRATVTYVTSICGRGDPTHAYTLVREAGKWRITGLDDGCRD